jgi:hypothetical protein
MSSLHAAPLAHRREHTRKIVMTLFDFADQRDEQAARRSYRRAARALTVSVTLIDEQGDQAGVDDADAKRRAVERALGESAGAQEFRANRRGLLNRPDWLKVRKLGTGGSPELEVFRNGFLGLPHRSFVMPNASALLFSESLIRAVGAFFGRKWRRGSGAPILLAIFDGKFCVLL